MSTPYSPRAELASALRSVNASYARLTAEQQAQVEMVDWEQLEAALKSGDEDRAYAAVAEWSYAQLEAIRVVSR